MPGPHPNVLTSLAAIDAFNRTDVAGVAEHVRADFVDRSPGRSIVADELRGVDGFIEALARLRDESDGIIDITPTAVLADDDNLIARARVTAERRGRHLAIENCDAPRFVDGKVADGQVFLSDPGQVDDFWGDGSA